MTTNTPLTVSMRGPARVLTICRPNARNAINRELAGKLRDAIVEASHDERVRAIVLTASGQDIFVAGGDLKEFQQLDFGPTGAEQIIEFGKALECIETSEVPVIAAVQGDVLGGGCELLVLCDLAIIEEHAGIEFRHARMGLTPAWGGSSRLLERVGFLRAAELLLTARRLTAAEALSFGLVNEVVAPGQALDAALKLAERIAVHARGSVAAVKRSLVAAQRAARSDAVSRERDVFRRAWGNPSHRAAMAAFLSRR